MLGLYNGVIVLGVAVRAQPLSVVDFPTPPSPRTAILKMLSSSPRFRLRPAVSSNSTTSSGQRGLASDSGIALPPKQSLPSV
ncbi:hypothetical protein GGR56DRAFT_151839 [Xylariaceae sp. FL0804]|nr:hypothetical protein GGR56DRAFT_151839 [Xylariaceae sp. FL0804]